MKTKSLFSIAACLVLTFVFASVAQATTIDFFTSTVTAGDPTQAGRLSRSGVPGDWSGNKPFPGEVNTATIYHYTKFIYDISSLQFIQVSVDDPTLVFFVSAYLDAYDPTNKALNYLGDEGFTGDPFPGDPGFFQVFVPTSHKLVLVVNDTIVGGSGLGQPFSIQVEGFLDSEYNDVPEPATFAMIGPGIAAALAMLRRRRIV